ncbi:hypothetical protein BSKO_12362 [Bryopsis sp. KO-2023]|nr:hypothetical protein BSKO_12362 [Bryopsis sp. KO-2023]
MSAELRSRRRSMLRAFLLLCVFLGPAAAQDLVIEGDATSPTGTESGAPDSSFFAGEPTETETEEESFFTGGDPTSAEPVPDSAPFVSPPLEDREPSESGESGTNVFTPEPIDGGDPGSQQSDGTSFGGTISSEPADEAISEIDVLQLEEPRSGTVAEEGVDLISIQLPANGTDYPNILLTLTTDNEEGDADILCLPVGQFNPAQPAQRGSSIWVSDHSQGKDYVFISRNHDLYEASKRQLKDPDLGSIPGISITCGIIGYAPDGTDYTLDLDIDYSERTLVESEQATMQEIFDKCCLDGPALCTDWKNFIDESGEVSMDFCHSLGSICDEDGSLVRLDLRKLNFGCKFPIDEIAKLKNLEKLQMESNGLEGNISEILESISLNLNLQHLDLSENSLSGVLDEEPLCSLTHSGRLEFLNLELNAFEGTIPECLFDESSTLKELIMDRNELAGELPPIPAASQLQVLRIAGAGLKGSLDASLGDLQSLVVLDLSMNHLEGTLPKDLGKSPSLRSVRLQDNNFEGAIPGSLIEATGIRYLHLENNRLESFAPEWYSGNPQNSSMLLMDASKNVLKGEFPTALLGATNLVALNLQENELSGPLPDRKEMLLNTVQFVVNGNLFEGKIPDSFRDIGFFNDEVVLDGPKHARRLFPIFDLASNKLSGVLPSFLSNDSIPSVSQGGVYLGGNDFELDCPIPAELSHIEDLECVDEQSQKQEEKEEKAIVEDGEDLIEDVDLLSGEEQDTFSLNQVEESQEIIKDEDRKTRRHHRKNHDEKKKKGSGSDKNIVIIVVGCIAAALFVSVLVVAIFYRKKIERMRQIDELVGRDVELNRNTL